MPLVVIEKLRDDHDAADFSCGEPALDRFIKDRAQDHQRKGYGKTWAAVLRRALPILGFYTLTATEIAFEDAPEKLIRGMPKYPVPCFLLARLAVDKKCQREGLGGRLVADAFARCANADVGAKCIVVDAKNDHAVLFYRKLGFIPFPDNPLKLFIKISTIEKALSANK